jgi:hypothetical protein
MRHPSVQHLIDLLDVNSNLPEHLMKISQRFAVVRDDILNDIKDDNPEVAAGMRKLLEAKDCFVRAAHLVATQAKEIVHDATTDPAPVGEVQS